MKESTKKILRIILKVLRTLITLHDNATNKGE